MRKHLIIKVLIFLNVIIYISFLFIDILLKDTENTYSRMLKYSTILIYFLISTLIALNKNHERHIKLLQRALGFTVFADLFLVILNWLKLGIFFFILVQLTYIKRHIISFNYYKKLIYSLLFIYLFLLVFLYQYKPNKVDLPLYILAITYGLILIFAFITSLNLSKAPLSTPYSKVFVALGMSLFFLCDFNVALNNILQEYNFTVAFFIWFFYFPSQLFLVLSSYSKKITI